MRRVLVPIALAIAAIVGCSEEGRAPESAPAPAPAPAAAPAPEQAKSAAAAPRAEAAKSEERSRGFTREEADHLRLREEAQAVRRAEADKYAAEKAASEKAAAQKLAPPKAAAERSAAAAPAAIPDFPWPPPAPSAQAVLPNSLFLPSGKPSPSLSAVSAQLTSALEQARYFEYSYYRVPNGFALVARLERIKADGTPLPEESRFLQPGSQEPFSLATYVKQLFFAPEGFYRLIAFVVTDQPFAASGEKIDAAAAADLLSKGANRLSKEFEAAQFTPAHRVSALIYEFRKGSKQGDVSTLVPGRLGARTHLDRAGIYRIATPQR